MSTTVGGAVIVGISAIVSALVAWLMNRNVAKLARKTATDLAELTAKQAAELEGIKSTHAAQLEGVKSAHVADVERLRHELGREAAQHEAALRVRSEVRLRLFERAVCALENAVRAAHDEPDDIYSMAVIALTGKKLPIQRQGELLRVGILLPPELEDAHRTLLGVLDQSKLVAASAAMGQLGREPKPALDSACSGARRAVEAFEAEARAWKRRHWNELTRDVSDQVTVTDEVTATITTGDGGDKR